MSVTYQPKVWRVTRTDAGFRCTRLGVQGLPGPAWTPAALADADAANGVVYFSTTQGKLAYKDAGGTVHTLY